MASMQAGCASDGTSSSPSSKRSNWLAFTHSSPICEGTPYFIRSSPTIHCSSGNFLVAQEASKSTTGMGNASLSFARLRRSRASLSNSVVLPAPGSPRMSNSPPAWSNTCMIVVSDEMGCVGSSGLESTKSRRLPTRSRSANGKSCSS